MAHVIASAASHASLDVFAGSTSTPLVAATALLQLGVPPLQGTEIVPTEPVRPIFSLAAYVIKTQVVAGFPDDGQELPAFFAKAYNV